jgi:hypothetical protein
MSGWGEWVGAIVKIEIKQDPQMLAGDRRVKRDGRCGLKSKQHTQSPGFNRKTRDPEHSPLQVKHLM